MSSSKLSSNSLMISLSLISAAACNEVRYLSTGFGASIYTLSNCKSFLIRFLSQQFIMAQYKDLDLKIGFFKYFTSFLSSKLSLSLLVKSSYILSLVIPYFLFITLNCFNFCIFLIKSLKSILTMYLCFLVY